VLQKHANDAEKLDKLLTASTSADAADAQQKEAERLERLAEQRRVEVIDLSSGDEEEDIQPGTSKFCVLWFYFCLTGKWRLAFLCL